MSNETKIDSIILIGSAGLSKKQKERGYVGTLCAQLEKPEIKFQDLHVTKSQLLKLKVSIENFLEILEAIA